MNPIIAIWRKECISLLRSTLSWCAFAGYVSATGLLFTIGLRHATGTYEHLPAILCTQLCLAMCIPAAMFTMSLFASERALGTIETLMTAPITDAQVVVGKFAASFTMTCGAVAAACLIFPAYLRMAAPPPQYSLLSLYAGIAVVLLFAAMWCALGTLLSLLSRHQAPPAIMTMILTLASAAAFTGMIPGFDSTRLLYSVRITDFARGTADSRLIFLAVSLTVFLLFCAVRVLESRRWASSK